MYCVEFSVCSTVNMDQVQFECVEDKEENYNLEEFFTNPIPYRLQALIEYRVNIVEEGNHIRGWRNSSGG